MAFALLPSLAFRLQGLLGAGVSPWPGELILLSLSGIVLSKQFCMLLSFDSQSNVLFKPYLQYIVAKMISRLADRSKRGTR